MTAPVAQQPAGERIAMTVPVSQRPEGGASRVAVVRFSGLARSRDVRARSGELVAWVESRRLRATGPASLARYDPPWTPWFMRRNEVMIPIQR